jgi:hypothetical protein
MRNCRRCFCVTAHSTGVGATQNWVVCMATAWRSLCLCAAAAVLHAIDCLAHEHTRTCAFAAAGCLQLARLHHNTRHFCCVLRLNASACPSDLAINEKTRHILCSACRIIHQGLGCMLQAFSTVSTRLLCVGGMCRTRKDLDAPEAAECIAG